MHRPLIGVTANGKHARPPRDRKRQRNGDQTGSTPRLSTAGKQSGKKMSPSSGRVCFPAPPPHPAPSAPAAALATAVLAAPAGLQRRLRAVIEVPLRRVAKVALAPPPVWEDGALSSQAVQRARLREEGCAWVGWGWGWVGGWVRREGGGLGSCQGFGGGGRSCRSGRSAGFGRWPPAPRSCGSRPRP